MSTLTPLKKNETAEEVVICVKTPFGIVRKRTTFAAAWQIKSLVIAIEKKLVQGEHGLIEKDTIVSTFWSDLSPMQARREVRASIRHLQLCDYPVQSYQVVPIQRTEALTRLEAVLRDWEFNGYIGTISELFDEASVVFGQSRTRYRDFAMSARVIAVVKRG